MTVNLYLPPYSADSLAPTSSTFLNSELAESGSRTEPAYSKYSVHVSTITVAAAATTTVAAVIM